MDKQYWIGRKRSAMAMARRASAGEIRLIHYDLAGRYSIMAAQCAPFMIPANAPVSEGERASLQPPEPILRRPPSSPSGRTPDPRRDPEGREGEAR